MEVGPNPVGSLQEYCVRKRIGHPIYTNGQMSGSDHCPTFFVWCSVLNFNECGNGTTKKDAKKSAASKVLSLMYANDKVTPKEKTHRYCNIHKRQKQGHDEVVVANSVTLRIEGTLGTTYDNNINKKQLNTLPIEVGNENVPLTEETVNNDLTTKSLENINTDVEMKCPEQSDNEKYPNSKDIEDVIEKVKREIQYEVLNLGDCIAKRNNRVMNPINELVHLCNMHHLTEPEYKLIDLTSTPERFTVCCTVNEYSELGKGPKKQTAQTDAATNMLKFLKQKLGYRL